MILRIIDNQTKIFLRDDFEFNPKSETGLEVEPAQGFYLPKWDGAQWVECRTAEEIAALKSSVTVEPTELDRLSALESAMLEMILGGSV